MKLTITKELFIETIEAIKNQCEHDSKCSEAFQVILPHDHISTYSNHWLQNQLVKLLQVGMNDEHKDSWIEYYLWELNFGAKYKPGMVTEKDGSIIDLSDAGKLYEYLKKQNLRIQGN